MSPSAGEFPQGLHIRTVGRGQRTKSKTGRLSRELNTPEDPWLDGCLSLSVIPLKHGST